MSGRTTHTPECACLNCGAKLSAATSVTGETPLPGSLSVCFRCGAVMIFNDDLTVRGLTDTEIADISSNAETMQDIARVVRTLHLIRANRN